MHSKLLDIVDRFAGRRVLLVGDFMLDRYICGDAERISPEAPVPVLRVVEREDRVGGAGSVALNIQALGGKTRCYGLLGEDTFGERVARLLADAGAEVDGLLLVGDRPTITKTRLIGLAEHRHRQQIVRFDDEVVRAPAEADSTRLIDAVQAMIPTSDVVCLEDYAKGVLSPEVCQAVIVAAHKHGKPVLIDPARSDDWSRYRGATLLTPNRAELELGVGRALRDDELDAESLALIKQLELHALIVTLGRDGARLILADGSTRQFPTRPRAVYDNTGAGDAVLAIAALAVAAGAALEEAVPLANIAGGLEVSKFGCVPIARQEVIDELRRGADGVRGKLRDLTELNAELSARRQRGETVVFTNGCFDLLHPGHVELLEKCKAMGSVLVVGLNTDASARAQHKADDRPVRKQVDRVRMLSALEAVDFVVLFDDPSVLRLVESVAPDVLVKGGDYDLDRVVGRDFVESHGGRVVLIDLVAGHSTTGELERIRTTGAPT